MRTIALMSLYGLAACTSPDKLLGDSNVFVDTNEDIVPPDTADTAGDTDTSDTADTDTDTSDTVDTSDTSTSYQNASVSDVLSGNIAEGTAVEMVGLIVNSPSSDEGFFAGDPNGGANSGIWIQSSGNKGVFDVQMGQTVSISGVYTEIVDTSPNQYGNDGTLTALVVASDSDIVVTDSATDNMAPATLISMSVFSDPATAEDYEGSYVQLSYPTMTQDGDGMILDEVLPFDETFVSFSHEELLSSPLEYVKGIVGYKGGQYVIYPCHTTDVNYAAPAATALDASKLFVSEVLAYSTPISECGGFSWYLEVNYNGLNSADLDLGTLFLRQTGAAGTAHAALTTPFPIAPSTLLLISDGIIDGCLQSTGDEASAFLSMNPVSGVSGGVPETLSAGDSIELYYAPSEQDYAIGNSIMIDAIELSTNAIDTSLELAPALDGNGTDGMSLSNGDWCESQGAIYLTSGAPVFDSNYNMVQGSPGDFMTHCAIGQDTASSSQ